MAEQDLTPDRIGQYYDEWTVHYQACFGDTLQACRPAQASDLHEYILQRAGIADGDHILDAGCGVCGPSLYFASQREISIDAVTVSRHQVTIARQLIANAGLERRINVHHGDFHHLDETFPEATFDRVLFLESLSHATDPTGPLRSAFRVLKPGGTVYIKDFFEKEFETEDDRRRVRETIERVDRTFVLKTPSLPHTIAVLTGLGFQRQRVEPVGFINDLSVWTRFNTAHRFDLYAGEAPIQWCDWVELTFQKPLSSAVTR